MSLLKIIWSLIQRPQLSSPANPKDAPLGSMYFDEPALCALDNVTEPYIQYEFSDNWEEDNQDVAKLGFEMIQRLCEGYIVLTEISSNKKGSDKNPVRPTDRFTVRYDAFLKNARPEVSVYMESERKLYVLSEGFNREAYFAYADINASDWCSFDYYLFRKGIAPISAKNAWEAVQDGCYDMRLFIADGPIAFEVVLNPETVDIRSIQTVVERVCKEHDILLAAPPECGG